MGTALAAAAIAVILFFGVLFWTSAPRAVAGLADAGRTAVSVAKDPSKRVAAATATVDPVEDAATRGGDTSSEVGDATVRAIQDATATIRETAPPTAQDAAEAAPSLDPLKEAAAQQAEDVRDAVKQTAEETARSVGDAVREAAADVTVDGLRDAAADKLQQAAEKLAQAAEKLEALADRIELSASPAEEPEGADAESGPAPRRASDEARRPGQAPPEARADRPVAAPTATASVAARATTNGRAPWVLMPRPEPASRVPRGALVLEARGRGDAPIARIRLVLDGAPLPVTLEQRGDSIWRAQAATSVAPGPHVVDAVVVDAEGRSGSYRWQFTAAP